MSEYSREEEYIIEESPELSIGETQIVLSKLKKAFPAFKHFNFRLYFSGQLISLIGTWLQMVALGWLVLEITNSAFWVGVISALGNLPILVFALFGGVIVDHFPKKRILFFTQSSAMTLAFVLGILTILRVVNLLEIAILAFLLGLVNALDSPARQSFVVEMVGKEDLPSAISLNSGAFNGARIIGPAIAGLLIAVIGTGGAFILNALSFIAVIIALFYIKVPPTIKPPELHPLLSIKQGLSYSFSHRVIRTLLIFATFTSIFGWSYSAIMPVIAKNVYNIGASGLGYLNAALGLGAVVATVLVSALSEKIDKEIFILGGNFLFCLSLIAFSYTHTLSLALGFLFLSGLGLLAQFAMINSTIQRIVPDHFRGRVMSIYTLMFVGMIPFGSFQIGLVSEKFGPLFGIRLGAIILLLVGLFVILNRHKLLKEP